MKFVFIFVALVCANLHFCQAGNSSGNQTDCTSPCAPGININVRGKRGIKKVCAIQNRPININVRGNKGEKGEKGDTGPKGESGAPCNCSLQDPNKPSAHIESTNKRATTYEGITVIKDWSLSAPHSHIAGGMKYQDGKLTVPISGRYYIYAQIYYHNNGRVHVRVNDKIITMTQPQKTGNSEGALYAGGVFNLKAGDAITLNAGAWPTSTVKVFLYTYHCYFGAFLI